MMVESLKERHGASVLKEREIAKGYISTRDPDILGCFGFDVPSDGRSF